MLLLGAFGAALGVAFAFLWAAPATRAGMLPDLLSAGLAYKRKR